MHTFSRLLIQASIAALLTACGDAPKPAPSPPATAKATLTVTTTVPQLSVWPQTLRADGNIAAWQEAVIGAEISNYRITEVRASVGDVVKKGQVLARIAADTVDSEVAEIRASVAEAGATLAEAGANQERSKQLREKGFYSAQQLTQTQTAVATAQARLDAARARLHTAELKRAKATVLSPDDGIISARTATVGTLTQAGQELFRLIRGGRLEWRAEVTAGELVRLKPGQTAALIAPNGREVQGVVRAIAPTVDLQTRNGLVYVDLPASGAGTLSAGMYASGEFRLGSSPALTLPQSAVVLREGFAYVFSVKGDKITQIKISIGRRSNERIEIGGLDAKTQVVTSGAGFLADGDTVRVVSPSERP